MKSNGRPFLYTLANFLTIGRLLATPLAIMLLLGMHAGRSNERQALYLLMAMQASDVLDGFLARSARRRTDRKSVV